MRISDWSSDVCSSDLQIKELEEQTEGTGIDVTETDGGNAFLVNLPDVTFTTGSYSISPAFQSSEARRVGKECVSTFRSRSTPKHNKKNHDKRIKYVLDIHTHISQYKTNEYTN